MNWGCQYTRETSGLPLAELFMGMSGDYSQVIMEGATIIRMGTENFGPRPPKQLSQPDAPPVSG